MTGTSWRNVGPLGNIPLRGARRLCLKHEGRPVAIFRTAEDAVFALVDECPHKKGPLSEGIVSGMTVTCPLHNWTIGLGDGIAAFPDEGRTASLPVKIVNGEIYIALPALENVV
ncbi:MAG: nitrite reductase (NAD(P)H) small subunit [Rhodospirillaceae bacterium]